MEIWVEFVGIPRLLAGVQEVTLSLPAGASYREVLRQLALRFPALDGQVIDADGAKLFPENKIALNGKRILTESELDLSPQDGDRLVILSVLAGG